MLMCPIMAQYPDGWAGLAFHLHLLTQNAPSRTSNFGLPVNLRLFRQLKVAAGTLWDVHYTYRRRKHWSCGFTSLYKRSGLILVDKASYCFFSLITWFPDLWNEQKDWNCGSLSTLQKVMMTSTTAGIRLAYGDIASCHLCTLKERCQFIR